MTATFECRLCGQEFGRKLEAEEHIFYNHDIVEEQIAVHDDANQEPYDD